ncbi:bifunctional diguanylate cyclase/phosphodiesterase [Desulfonatronum sp. SC1]|uniref:putative bifunctional diguanylate cyclase/phosphodiesterase n=1 Tax=Desulfonatronum sp. SC1 TaxID=2109626 RepID=UPI0018EEA540|nr:EAL domain-containing protein [Desulfonatronum sp. SC1]
MNTFEANRRHRVLVIDDTPAIHEDFRKTLAVSEPTDKGLLDMESELFGVSAPEPDLGSFSVDFASQGREGVDMAVRAKAEELPYALAFVDGRMPPGMDGIETIRELWQSCPDLQIVLCTASADYSWRGIQTVLGTSDNLVILKKPFDTMEVLQLTHALTRKWALSREIKGRLYKLAYYDSLTDLPNRTFFLDRLEYLLKTNKRYGHTGALLFLDLDAFKRINDSLGHGVGDELLKVISLRMLDCLRGMVPVVRLDSGDMAARLGGDEFAVILSNLEQPDTAANVALRITEHLARPITVGSHQVSVTSSIGITLFPQDGEDVETLMKNADLAMYNAKRRGPNAFLFYRDFMNVTVRKRLALEHHLRRAIAENELSLHYQPQINLTTGQVVGLEALLRWDNPELGMIPPLEFIPIAEENGLIISIGEWVLRAACTQAKAWLDQGVPLPRVGVNIALSQLIHGGFLAMVDDVLAETTLPPRLLEMEITESMLMSDPDGVARVLHKLRERGIKVAIDDFGTGYSSLGRLRDLPIDCLKIDRCFIRGISMGMRDEPILNAMIGMAAALDLRVVAEGVESAGQVDFLRSSHCPEVQGFLFSHPLSASQAEIFLRDNSRARE